MFNNKEARKEQVELSNSSTQIMKGTTVEGNIETFGNVRVEGKILGNIKSKSKIALGDSSYVEGNIISQNAEIAGEVKGTVDVTEVLTLKATAVIKGDIVTGKLVVEAGAVWNGTIKMGTAPKEIKIGDAVNGAMNGQLKEQEELVK
ncbi:MAG: polymer-forming cytoskeletal protein [Cytophagales bacterium]|nr:polymer-forming cytoskeletal protein [Cytophagales bacterium]